MNTRLIPLLKRVLYPGLLVLAHSIAENWTGIVHTLGPHYAFLAGPTVVLIGGAILHALEAPGKSDGN